MRLGRIVDLGERKIRELKICWAIYKSYYDNEI